VRVVLGHIGIVALGKSFVEPPILGLVESNAKKLQSLGSGNELSFDLFSSQAYFIAYRIPVKTLDPALE
jgi:hypothetical protein